MMAAGLTLALTPLFAPMQTAAVQAAASRPVRRLAA